MPKPRRNSQTQRTADLLAQIKYFVVADAIGVTSLRGQPKKTRETVHKFLKGIDLSRIPGRGPAFMDWLDGQTDRLQRKLLPLYPPKSNPWGVARKALNLFLRACLYNHYLRSKYHLEKNETLLEIPLDSVVGRSLVDEAQEAGGRPLPPWPGLKYLTPETSNTYQEYAAGLADKKGLPALVFLDNYLFLGHRSKQAFFRKGA